MRGVDGVDITTTRDVVTAIRTSTSCASSSAASTPRARLMLAAIAHGKHVVTANKALLATHGNEIFAAAHPQGVMVAFEAAVAGGIPIIKALREGLTANRIEWIAGIINGTSATSSSRRCAPRARRSPTC